jgi:O-antigen/teichoic acid export membrane protein
MNAQSIGLFEKFKESASQTAIYGIGFVLRQGGVYLLTPVYAHRLSNEEYAILALGITFGALVGQLARFGTEQAVFRSYHDYEEVHARKTVISTAIFMTLFLTVIVLGLVLLIEEPISDLLLGDTKYIPIIRLVLGSVFFQNLTYVPLAVFRLKMQAIRYSSVSLISIMIQAGLTIYLVVVLDYGIEGVLYANLAAAAVSSFFMIALIFENISIQVSKAEIRKMISYGAPFGAQGILVKTMDGSDRYVMQFLGLTSMVGVYTLGYTIGQVVQAFVTVPLSLMLTPVVFSMEKHPQAKRFYASIATYAFVFAIGFALAIALSAEYLVQIIAPQEYHSAWIVVPIIALTFALIAVQPAMCVGLALKRKTVYHFINWLIATPLAIILSIWWIPRWGMSGGAFARLLSGVFIFFFPFFISQRYYRIDYQWRRLFHVLLLGLFIYSVTSFVKVSLPWAGLLIKIVLWLMYPILLFVTGFMTSEEKNRLISIWKQDVIGRVQRYRSRSAISK